MKFTFHINSLNFEPPHSKTEPLIPSVTAFRDEPFGVGRFKEGYKGMPHEGIKSIWEETKLTTFAVWGLMKKATMWS